ncbi:MAG TPA: cytochrome b [Rhodopila sp.]|jgi:cytochrome b561|nr:cytochrome b [Rhodopila sp.]
MELNRDFTTTAKFLHWLMAAIIIVGWFIGFYGAEMLSYNVPHSGKAETITLHKDIASTVMLLIVLRSLWRLTHRPPHVAQESAFQRFAVWAGHLSLYVLMFFMPISGWALSSSAGYTVKFAGVLALPPLMAKNMTIEPTFDAIHKYIGWFVGIIILGHIAMALKHHFIDRDYTLRGMLPRAR